MPVAIIWGEKDPWEPVALGQLVGSNIWNIQLTKRSCLRNLKQFPCVKRFVRLPNVGHCPHDEAPDRVNPVLEEIISEFTSTP